VFCDRQYGESGLKGVVLGLFATGFNILALAGVVWLLGKAHKSGQPPRLGASFAVLAFLIKLPLFVAFGVLANRMGGAAPTCFLLGLGMVYCALIGWALAIG
jgi:hypothetical protein